MYINKLCYSHSVDYYRAMTMTNYSHITKKQKSHKDNVKCKYDTRAGCQFHLSEIRNQATLSSGVRTVIVLGRHETGRGHTGRLGEATQGSYFHLRAACTRCVQFIKWQVAHL